MNQESLDSRNQVDVGANHQNGTLQRFLEPIKWQK